MIATAALLVAYMALGLLSAYALGRLNRGNMLAIGWIGDEPFIAFMWPLAWLIRLAEWAGRKGRDG